MSVCVVGSLNLDLVARVQALPRPGETVLASALSRHPGGKGLNQAIAAARAGAEVAMLGAVGRDEPGDWLLGRLADARVDAGRIVRDADAATGQALISVAADGENCIVVVAGANAAAAPAAADVAAGTRVVLAQLETAIDPLAALLAQAPAGAVKILNTAPAVMAAAALFALCDVLILNETELAAYAGEGALADDLGAVAAAARSLLTRPGQSAVVTLGAKGVLLVDAEGQRHIPGHPAQVVDTVGAGDCFCGVLAAGLAAGLDLAAAAERANAAAAIAVSRPGVSDAMPTRAEIDAAVGPIPQTRPVAPI